MIAVDLMGQRSCAACPAGLYESNRECIPCPRGFVCGTGSFIETLGIIPGYWRATNISLDIQRCPGTNGTSPCVGGNASWCAEGHEGLFCTGCVKQHGGKRRYFDEASIRCQDPDVTVPVVTLATALIVTGGLLLLLYNPPTLLQSSVAKVNGYYDWILKHGLVHKLKDAVSLYQCLDALDTVYDAKFSQGYRDSVFAPSAASSFNYFGWLYPGTCLRTQGNLLLRGYGPLMLIAVIFLGSFCVAAWRHLFRHQAYLRRASDVEASHGKPHWSWFASVAALFHDGAIPQAGLQVMDLPLRRSVPLVACRALHYFLRLSFRLELRVQRLVLRQHPVQPLDEAVLPAGEQ